MQLSRSSLQILAVASILLAATHVNPTVSVTCAVVGLVLAYWGVRATRLKLTTGSEHRLAGIVSLVLLTGALGRPIGTVPSSLLDVRSFLLVLGFVASVILVFRGHTALGRRVSTILVIFVALVSLGVMGWHEWSSATGSDVYHAHRAAGVALIAGDGPYSDAVRFADGNPFAPLDRVIEGYPYPPVVLLAYGLAGAFTDPRLISTIAWMGFLAWFAWGSWSDKRVEGAGLKLAMLSMLVLAPLSSEVWYMGWTEPLSLVLFLCAALSWNRSHTWSGVLLGLALASKQYLIILLPLVLLHRDEGWRKRSTVALITAGSSLLIGLIPNPTAFLRSTIGNLTSIGFRPDTQSLPGMANRLGFDFLLPNWIWVLLSIGVAVFLARSSKARSGFLIRAGVGLGVAFLIGLAFPNYWFLVAGLLALGIAFQPADDVSDTSPGVNLVSTQESRAETRIAGV